MTTWSPAPRPSASRPRANRRGARLGLALGTDAGEAHRVEERLERLLDLARLDAARAELVVAPPEPAINLLAALGRQHLVGQTAEQLVRALQRAQRFRLARLLHAADRLRRELADLAAERAREQLAEGLAASRRKLGVVERLAQQATRGAELLLLHHP